MSSESQNKQRRKFTPDQKFKIIKEQMTTRTSVSDICKKYDISAGNFYKWQEKFLKSALEGFKKADEGATKAELRKIEQQAQKITRLQEAITEIVQENIELKKILANSSVWFCKSNTAIRNHC